MSNSSQPSSSPRSSSPSSPSIPHGATAVRLQWYELPGLIRARIEERLGGRVVAVTSQDSGFSPGFAARLVIGRRQRVFVKAASVEDTPDLASAYRVEAETSARLPEEVPAPVLRWTFDEAGWTVLCFDDVPGHPPHRPWRPEELTASLTALTVMAQALTPGPPDLVVPEAREWLRDDFGYWTRLAGHGSGETDPQVAELAALEKDALDALRGDSIIHADLRDDNVIVGDGGQVWFCDWNWASRGAPWFDLLLLLISARADGYDTDALFAAHPLGADVDAEAVDAVLAGLAGYFTRSSLLPPDARSPHLRAHQASYAAAALSWLAVRRGWVG